MTNDVLVCGFEIVDGILAIASALLWFVVVELFHNGVG
jgi:hypothetical protein